MNDYIEIRWHGRAQQGVVTAAKVLGETALSTGKFVQAFPEFGPERMGAPVRAYNRVSGRPIRRHCQVRSPKIVLIVDPTLIGTVNVKEGTPDDALFIINSPRSAAEMRDMVDVASDKVKVYVVDASAISVDEIGRHIPNTPMLGALAKVSGVVELDALMRGFKENYAKKYSPRVIAGNLAAIKRGYREVGGE